MYRYLKPYQANEKKEAEMNAQLYTKWDAINFTRIINNHTLMGDL